MAVPGVCHPLRGFRRPNTTAGSSSEPRGEGKGASHTSPGQRRAFRTVGVNGKTDHWGCQDGGLDGLAGRDEDKGLGLVERRPKIPMQAFLHHFPEKREPGRE